MTTYLDEDRPFPYCPGCGHPHVLRALDAAFAEAGVPREQLALVTDIGCVGLADALFPSLHTVHTLHGRASAIATGIRLGSGGAAKPVVLVGDGGASIGLLHLVHAAQLDVDVTVVVHNNLVYGMTGGQHSTLTPAGLVTTTTPAGCPVPPLDLGAVLVGAGATFFARSRAPGGDLAPILARAIGHPGFACVEALELCPSFAAKVGGVTGKTLDALAQARTGILHHAPRPALPPSAPPPPSEPPPPADPLAGGLAPDPSLARLCETRRILLAGKAGERVQSAARFAATAALAAGLFAAVRTDNPVTQGKGFSLAELTVSPKPIHFTGMPRPDLVLVLAEEGLASVAAAGLLARPDVPVVLDDSLPADGAGGVDRRPFRRRYGAKAAALGALIETIRAEGWWDDAAFDRARSTLGPAIAADVDRVLAKVASP